jgi:hypothetical protein
LAAFYVDEPPHHPGWAQLRYHALVKATVTNMAFTGYQARMFPGWRWQTLKQMPVL